MRSTNGPLVLFWCSLVGREIRQCVLGIGSGFQYIYRGKVQAYGCPLPRRKRDHRYVAEVAAQELHLLKECSEKSRSDIPGDHHFDMS